jgi:hypothetical protein
MINGKDNKRIFFIFPSLSILSLFTDRSFWANIYTQTIHLFCFPRAIYKYPIELKSLLLKVLALTLCVGYL